MGKRIRVGPGRAVVISRGAIAYLLLRWVSECGWREGLGIERWKGWIAGEE